WYAIDIRHLYFHIPFCAKLCPYCSFYVDTHFKNKSARFLDALLNEVKQQTARHPAAPHTIYFGGGTPSSLSISEIESLARLRDILDFSKLEEWTFEINPATVSTAKARALLALGVNRISMGVQSWDDGLLKTLGRIHTAAQAEETFRTLREAGFENISIDLMFAVPGQTRDQWVATLEKTISLRPEHISSYCLTYEEDTEYFRKLRAHEFSQDTERDADFFELTMDTLGAAGYSQYEISNYALPGRESRHNFAYWDSADYLGFGPGAFSTVGEHRWQNIADTAAYTGKVLAGESPVSLDETVKPSTRTGERIAFSLRTIHGVPDAMLEPWRTEVEEFRKLGFLEHDGGKVLLTRKGKLMADSVAEIFV
ncbi:MAG TPA: radical SAM family heme chaperone HemW, partial [Chthoniobacteraceae bacterium]|nr:radical SAM family heme chaperone HemW [Chthoniobacteraceae bacterium]